VEEAVVLVDLITYVSVTWMLILFRPKEFPKTSAYPEDSDDEESTVGKMPPSDSEDE
jgi:hypothetical protein